MTTVNHECYISLEAAKLLKEAGFDWECEHCYFNDKFDEDLYEPDNFLDCTYQIAAPTLEVTQRWLREMTTWQVEAICVYKEHKKLYSYCVFHDEYKDQILEEDFKTYEEAQEAGIKKALELILDKEE